MSGNVKDTNVHKVRSDVAKLTEELNDLRNRNEDIMSWSDTLSRKYRYLVKTSKTLFNYIIKEYAKDAFDLVFFNRTLEMMLAHITQIQQSDISQHDASVNIGSHLANTFIPQIRKN